MLFLLCQIQLDVSNTQCPTPQIQLVWKFVKKEFRLEGFKIFLNHCNALLILRALKGWNIAKYNRCCSHKVNQTWYPFFLFDFSSISLNHTLLFSIDHFKTIFPLDLVIAKLKLNSILRLISHFTNYTIGLGIWLILKHGFQHIGMNGIVNKGSLRNMATNIASFAPKVHRASEYFV